MAKIKVDGEVMRAKANTFRTVAENIETLTGDMTKEIQSLENTWKGTAAENLIQKFKDLHSTFEEKNKTIIQYAEFLEKAAEAYEQREGTIVNALS